jgi:hypothetical protein
MDMMKESVVENQREKDLIEERQMLRHIEKREKAEQEREREDKDRAKRNQAELRRFLARQVEERHNQKDLEKEKNNLYIKEVINSNQKA